MLKFLVVDNGLPLSPYIYETSPIGGSELSLLLTCEGLAYLGNKVTLLNTSLLPQTYPDLPNLVLDHNSKIREHIKENDVILFNRLCPSVEILEECVNLKKKVYYWAHDAFDQPNVFWLYRKDLVNYYDRILCVSEWQAKTFKEYFNVGEEKIRVLPNACFKIDWMNGYTKRTNTFIFASIPYKGLSELKRIFDHVCVIAKRDDLNLLVYSSFGLYQRENDTEYIRITNELKATPGVGVRPLVSPVELCNVFRTTRFYIHPSTYHETFGMVIAQAMACGCIPIVVNNGALPELVIDKKTGFITKGVNIKEESTFREFVDLCVEALDYSKSSLISQNCELFVTTYRHTNIATKLLRIIEEE